MKGLGAKRYRLDKLKNGDIIDRCIVGSGLHLRCYPLRIIFKSALKACYTYFHLAIQSCSHETDLCSTIFITFCSGFNFIIYSSCTANSFKIRVWRFACLYVPTLILSCYYIMNTPQVYRSLWMCAPTVNLGDCTCILRFWVQCKWIMAETERRTELTTVVLDGDVIGQELVLASHTNEQWASSPVGRVGKRKCGWVGRQEGIKVRRHTTLSETHSVTWCCHGSEC